MPFVLTGNRESDTMCRFGMAEIQQGGGARASIGECGLLPRHSDCVDQQFDVSLLTSDKSPIFIDTVSGRPREPGKAAFSHPKPLRDHQHAAQFPARGQSTRLKGRSP